MRLATMSPMEHGVATPREDCDRDRCEVCDRPLAPEFELRICAVCLAEDLCGRRDEYAHEPSG